MARNRLDGCGNQGTSIDGRAAFQNMATLSVFWVAVNGLAGFALYTQWRRNNWGDFSPILSFSSVEFIAVASFNAVMVLLVAYLVWRTRRSIREKYDIKEERCHGQEDIMCAICCMPCSICHMGRHTADYSTYSAKCCTETGLPQNVQVRSMPPKGYSDAGHLV